MKFKVEVDETMWSVNTYIVEAESEDRARKQILAGYGEGFIELVETHTDTSEITDVRMIEPIPEAVGTMAALGPN